LKQKTSVSIIILIIAIFVSTLFTAGYVSNNLNDSSESIFEEAQYFTASMPLVLNLSLNQDQTIILNQLTRNIIYSFVRNNPGTHFRAICDNLGLSIGVVQHHLRILTKADLITSHNDKSYKRYFQSKKFSESEKEIISLLRHETPRRVLIMLSNSDEPVYHKDLASKLSISSQALSWHMNHLRKGGFIEATEDRMRVKYLLKEETCISIQNCIRTLNL
jgi:predicted transcriptional regulator